MVDPLLVAGAAVGAVCFLAGLMLIVIRTRHRPISLTEKWMPYRSPLKAPTLADEAEDWLSRQAR